VGDGNPPFIVAEVGINHNGELDRALNMIAVAKAAGADAVKFQTFQAEEFVGDPAQMFTYRSQGKRVTESMLEMFRRYEFPRSDWMTIKRTCDETGIMFLSTPQNRSDLDLLLGIGISAIKVGSDDFTNLSLLKSYAATGMPLILSCGMSDLAEVYQALEAVGALRGYPTVLLLCTSQYPTPHEDVNLLKLKTLSHAFPMVVMGFSDHTQGPLASSLAVALGGHFFEKHVTLDHDLPGPDHWFSANPAQLQEWVISIRNAYAMLGSAVVAPTSAEVEMRTLARRSVVALKDIEPGEVLTEANIGLRRPGNGMAPYLYPQMLGMKAERRIKRGALLQLGDMLNGAARI
jgi:sialic acid synthase SpsE